MHDNNYYPKASEILQIKNDVREMKTDLAAAFRDLSTEIANQTRVVEMKVQITAKQTEAINSQIGAINNLAVKSEMLSNQLLQSIPIKSVMWMFLILGLTIVLVIAGVEGVRALAPHLPGVL